MQQPKPQSSSSSSFPSSPIRPSLAQNYESRLAASPSLLRKRLPPPTMSTSTSTSSSSSSSSSLNNHHTNGEEYINLSADSFNSPGRHTRTSSLSGLKKRTSYTLTTNGGGGGGTSIPSSTTYGGDRFIPSRTASNFEIGFSSIQESSFLLSSPNGNLNGLNPSSAATAATAAQIEGTQTPTSAASSPQTSVRDSYSAYSAILRSELLGVTDSPISLRRSMDTNMNTAAASATSNGSGGVGIHTTHYEPEKEDIVAAAGISGVHLSAHLMSQESPSRNNHRGGGGMNDSSIHNASLHTSVLQSIAQSPTRNMLRFRSPVAQFRHDHQRDMIDSSASSVGGGSSSLGTGGSAESIRSHRLSGSPVVDTVRRGFSTLSPIGNASSHLLTGPSKTKRRIAKGPFKVLDAPSLQDDFYLNLVDWSSLNVLAVGLASSVYLWSACTSKVTKLCEVGPNDSITSVSWTNDGIYLAVGTNKGDIRIYDAAKYSLLRTVEGHSSRVGTMAWNGNLLASGSRDKMILLRDLRDTAGGTGDGIIQRFGAHKQEVCGLRWSPDERLLASGGNDNKLLIWNVRSSSSSPMLRFADHHAAVKAIAWSPHQSGVIASGGGTADRCIRFWNTTTGSRLSCVDTGSQVCNLSWSKNLNEIVSTHGYSLNQIIVWKYPSMTKVATLQGHTQRVIFLAVSPDGQTICTGAGDETLRFWNVFPGSKSKDGSRLGGSLGLSFLPGNDVR